MNRSSSDTGPAVMPSGGSLVRCLYSEKRRFEATEAMVDELLVRSVRDGARADA